MKPFREQDRVKAQARLDASLFARQTAPRPGITDRYIGEEPYCLVTAECHVALREILPAAGVAVHFMPRIAAGGDIVSVSKARDPIRAGDLPGLDLEQFRFEFVV